MDFIRVTWMWKNTSCVSKNWTIFAPFFFFLHFARALCTEDCPTKIRLPDRSCRFLDCLMRSVTWWWNDLLWAGFVSTLQLFFFLPWCVLFRAYRGASLARRVLHPLFLSHVNESFCVFCSCAHITQSLLQSPLQERRKRLRGAFKEVEGRFRFATSMDHKVRRQQLVNAYVTLEIWKNETSWNDG